MKIEDVKVGARVRVTRNQDAFYGLAKAGDVGEISEQLASNCTWLKMDKRTSEIVAWGSGTSEEVPRQFWVSGHMAVVSTSDLELIEAAPETLPSPDPVNAPSHYTTGGIECIEAIKASMSHEAFCGYLKGNAQKYMWRYEKKVNPAEDLAKANWYLDRLRKEQNDD